MAYHFYYEAYHSHKVAKLIISLVCEDKKQDICIRDNKFGMLLNVLVLESIHVHSP